MPLSSARPPPTRQRGHEDRRVRVVSAGVSLCSPEAALERVLAWTSERTGRYVTLTNVHMLMEAHDSPEFQRVVDGADLVLPDGMPVVWGQRLFGHEDAARVPGPQLTEALLEAAAARGIPVCLYGGSEATLAALGARATERWPSLRIVSAISPPFRPLTEEEDAEHVRRIIDSGARLIFVGLGCPKQERWMAAHVDRVPAPMLGVGQAFDIIAGVRRDAPAWMQRLGLGWLFRFAQEPRRLWRRYTTHNPRYLALLIAQRLRRRR